MSKDLIAILRLILDNLNDLFERLEALTNSGLTNFLLRYCKFDSCI